MKLKDGSIEKPNKPLNKNSIKNCPSKLPEWKLPDRGALPHGHRVPFLPNAVFTDRQECLEKLADILLHSGKNGLCKSGVIITGIGGVGKSQLALEFCYRYGRFFQGVHWIQANLNISAEVAECGLGMGLPDWPDKLPEQVAATIKAWREGGRGLIVLDNVEDPQLLNEWMPKLLPCRLLITSRREEWPADLDLKAMRLDELIRIQSIELLRKLAPRLRKTPDIELDKLADQLGDLPLALDLAGRYLADRRELSIKGYIEELEEAGNAPGHTSMRDWVKYNPMNHPTSLAVTFSASWDRLGETDDLAKLLFRAGGYCASDTSIPRQIFAETIRPKGSDQDLDRAIRKLNSLGLMHLTEGGQSMHTLQANFARLIDQEAKDSILKELANTMVKLTNQALESGLPEGMRLLRKHLEALAQASENAGLETAGALWSNLGVILEKLADYKGANACLERALKIDEKIYGPDHPEVATRVSNLGSVLQDLGELQEARRCFERALQIDERVYGPDHLDIAVDSSNLGQILQELGELQEARKLYERALLIHRKVFGPNHPNVARDLSCLSSVLQDLGELGEARMLIERTLQIGETVYGTDHPMVALIINNLGSVLQDLGELQEARKCFERALQIDEKIFGPDHPEVAIRVSNLGSVLQDLGDLQDARKCFERAMQINEKIFGPEHPKRAADLNNLGSVLKAQGCLQEAAKLYELASSINKKVFPEYHPRLAADANNLGSVLRDLGEFQEARRFIERALLIDEKIFGPDHPAVATNVNNLGLVLQSLDEEQEARKCFERALRILRQKLGNDHPKTNMVQRNLELLGS